MVESDERRRHLKVTPSSETPTPIDQMAFAVNSGSRFQASFVGTRKKEPFVCNHCGNTGHTKDRYFKQYPELRFKTSSQNYSKNRAPRTAAVAEASFETLSDAPADINQLRAEFYKADGNFASEEKSPHDTNGYGTHTASTVAGPEKEDASFLGIAKGTLRGAVPSAKIAVYKVCFQGRCYEHDILAGVHDAIADGVDVMSISLGHPELLETFVDDPIAIGAFHAMQKGTLVFAGAGNEGPGLKTRNDAPWILTSGASTIDRRIISNVVLGNDMALKASSCSIIATIRKLLRSTLTSEEFRVVPSPPCFKPGRKNANLALLGGCLCVTLHYGGWPEIWMMKDYMSKARGIRNTPYGEKPNTGTKFLLLPKGKGGGLLLWHNEVVLVSYDPKIESLKDIRCHEKLRADVEGANKK
ncbi:hypothetical protein IFM89_035174 [Coptis chinensis]|uniref:Peptidase S8/S53 domain-containing protein n=1 Tax=Coptis chinensis TaxID=261450 RepID=A0A835MGR7_9MAGN|nr:hypothetical protein IFM89_035174 [Coptis chinensis]